MTNIIARTTLASLLLGTSLLAGALPTGSQAAESPFAEQPERVTVFVIQNANAYEEGLRAF